MKIKDVTKFSDWRFSMINPADNTEFLVPYNGNAKGLHALVDVVVAQMDEFDRISNKEYSKLARAEAVKRNISFPAYVSLLIQHQICLKGKAECWSSGIGDDIHSLFKGVDKLISKLPSPLKAAAQKVTSAITKGSKTFSGCSSCGGTKSFSPSKASLGRAGKLNKKD